MLILKVPFNHFNYGVVHPEHIKWLNENFVHFSDFRWFRSPPDAIEIHLLNPEVVILFKLAFSDWSIYEAR